MSNYNEVADRLDNERLLASLGDRQLAARVLRSVATASADAEKSFKGWTDTPNDPYAECDINTWGEVYEIQHTAYLAGHAARQARCRRCVMR